MECGEEKCRVYPRACGVCGSNPERVTGWTGVSPFGKVWAWMGRQPGPSWSRPGGGRQGRHCPVCSGSLLVSTNSLAVSPTADIRKPGMDNPGWAIASRGLPAPLEPAPPVPVPARLLTSGYPGGPAGRSAPASPGLPRVEVVVITFVGVPRPGSSSALRRGELPPAGVAGSQPAAGGPRMSC